MTEREKMLSGELYDPTDKELEQLRLNARKLARKYNLTDEDQPEEQAQILQELLPTTEELPYLQAPVYFDYGCNTFFGRFSSANFNFTCLDVCEIHIGDNVMIGPNVTLATPMHPLLPEERNIRKREDGNFYRKAKNKTQQILICFWLLFHLYFLQFHHLHQFLFFLFDGLILVSLLLLLIIFLLVFLVCFQVL